MSQAHPRLDLNRLREIGWSLWDPLDLDGGTGVWKEESFADEYDKYLTRTAEMLRDDQEYDAIVRYLFYIESEWMSLGPKEMNQTIAKRLARIVQAIADDPDIWIGDQS